MRDRIRSRFANRVFQLALILLLSALTGCSQDPQASAGEGWRWLATSADTSERFLRPLTTEQELADFWTTSAETQNPLHTGQPTIDFDSEFVLVLSTRGRGTEPKPCGVYFRGLQVERESREVTVRFEPDTSAQACDAGYVSGQYVIAVDWDFTGPPPFDLLIDEPGQAGQPDPVQVTE